MHVLGAKSNGASRAAEVDPTDAAANGCATSNAAAPTAAEADRAGVTANGVADQEQATTVPANEDGVQGGTGGAPSGRSVQPDGVEEASTPSDGGTQDADGSSHTERTADGPASCDAVAPVATGIAEVDSAALVADGSQAENVLGGPNTATLDAATASSEKLRVEDVWDFKRKQATWHSLV